MFQDTGTLQRVSFEQTSGFGRRGAIDGRSAFATPAKTLLRSDDPAFRARRLTGKDEAASRRPTYIVRPMTSGLLCGRKLWNAIPPASAPWAPPRRAIAAWSKRERDSATVAPRSTARGREKATGQRGRKGLWRPTSRSSLAATVLTNYQTDFILPLKSQARERTARMHQRCARSSGGEKMPPAPEMRHFWRETVGMSMSMSTICEPPASFRVTPSCRSIDQGSSRWIKVSVTGRVAAAGIAQLRWTDNWAKLLLLSEVGMRIYLRTA